MDKGEKPQRRHLLARSRTRATMQGSDLHYYLLYVHVWTAKTYNLFYFKNILFPECHPSLDDCRTSGPSLGIAKVRIRINDDRRMYIK